MEGRSEIALRFPLLLFKFSGQHPKTGKVVFYAATTMMLAASSMILSAIFYHFYLTFGDPFLFLETVGSFGVYIQVIGKVVIVTFKRNDLNALIEDSKLFWDPENAPEELKSIFNLIFAATIRLQRIWFYMCAITISLTILQAYLSKQLPLGIWLIEGHNTYYMFQLCLQSFSFIYIVITQTIAIDQIFITLCTMLNAQFRMLNYNFRELKMQTITTQEDQIYYIKNISTYIKHHDFLLRFVKDLSKTYAPVMLNEYVSLITAMCSAMLVILESLLLNTKFSNNTGDKVSNTLLMICCFVQLSFYCLVGDHVCDQAYEVSNAIYETDWYTKYFPENRHLIPLIIQRSQKEINFSAGGLIQINSGTLLTIMKIAWSICVATRSMRHIR